MFVGGLSWQVDALRLESILVGDVVDGVPDVGDRVDIAVATLNSEALVFGADVHHLCRLLTALAVRQLVTELITVNTDVIQRGFFDDYGLAVVLAEGYGYSDGHKGAESDDLNSNDDVTVIQ